MKTRHKSHLSNADLHYYFDLFNARYFGGRLKVSRVEFKTMDSLGHTSRVRVHHRHSKDDKWWITIKRAHSDSRRISLGSLLHEMVHVEQCCKFSCGVRGRRFNRRMKELATLGALNGLW